MEKKFTKGEWCTKGSLIYCGEKAIGSTFYARKTDETRLSGESWLDMRKRTAAQREVDTKIEPEANAKLMAAAPEMLDVLISIVHDYEGDGMEGMRARDEVFYRLAQQAIKKATE